MTIRQRHAPGFATATLPVSHGLETGSERTAPFSWEDWFRHATPQQRTAALGLAHQQGLLYPHQLPAITNGVRETATPPSETPASLLVTRVLAGKCDAFAPLSAEPIQFLDPDLDALQQQAVRRALGTPDVFLLHGLPGTGKSRVLAEVIAQSALRGRRVLFLAGQTNSLDVVLERLVNRAEVFALRFLDPQERPEGLPAWLRSFTLEEQKKNFLERTLTGARVHREAVESACRRRHAEEPLWEELRGNLGRTGEVQARLHSIETELPRQEEVVNREAENLHGDSPICRQLADLRRACETDLALLQKQADAQKELLALCDREVADCTARLTAIEPAYRAKKESRFWSGAFWSNLFNSGLIPEAEALIDQKAKGETRQNELLRQAKQTEEQRHACQQRFTSDRAEAIAREIADRREALLREKRDVETEVDRLNRAWAEGCERLGIEPIEKSSQAFAEAQQGWLSRKQVDEQQCQFAHQWGKFVDEAGPQLAARLPGYANVLAGTISRWVAEGRTQWEANAPADLLILEDADLLTEADLLQLTRHGKRCVLVADALAEPAATAAPVEKSFRSSLPPIRGWHRLWQGLGGDAETWPCSWRRDHERLTCELRTLSPEDRQHVEWERLTDAPDIELGILHRPRTEPFLVQVKFPATMAFGDAFRFLVGEVQEFPLEPLGRSGWWCEENGRVVRRFGVRSLANEVWHEVEPGVRLGLGPDGVRVACIEFDPAAGWDCTRAKAWLHRHCQAPESERTVFLQFPHRFQPTLRRIVRTVIRARDWAHEPGLDAPLEGRSVEFVPIPSLQRPEWPREGAGLELDLAAGRFSDRLPGTLRQGLPSRGIVNYVEAQTLVRRLESFLQTDVNGQPCRVAVCALYEGQVELLRRLIAQSDFLRSSRVSLEVALPSQLAHREFEVVFLSMTRSHAQRAVPFGDNVNEVPLALTRARTRILIFADPGCLSKRIHSQGPIDQRDAYSAQQEMNRLARLVAFLQNHAPAAVHTNGK